MSTDVVLRMSGNQKEAILRQLFLTESDDGSVITLCGRRPGEERLCLSVSKILPFGSGEVARVQRPQDVLGEEARSCRLSVVRFSRHCGDLRKSDDNRELWSVVQGSAGIGEGYGAVVVENSGRMWGGWIGSDGEYRNLALIAVAGEMIEFWPGHRMPAPPDCSGRHGQVLGEETTALLCDLSAAVVGCSGTGSLTVEQLFRLGIGRLVLVDPDEVGVENLNRIVNSRRIDATEKLPKVHVLERAILESQLGTKVLAIAEDLCTPVAVRHVAECDIIFGCVDSVFARHLLNKIASTYCIPFIDIGVGIKADGHGGIEHITGGVHYLQPDGSSLLSRRVYSLEELQADALQRSDKEEYECRRAAGYVRGAEVARPAVISINTVFSGMGVFEFLCRLRALRDESNKNFASQRISLSHNFSDANPDGPRCVAVSRNLGRGDMKPLLGMPELSEA